MSVSTRDLVRDDERFTVVCCQGVFGPFDTVADALAFGESGHHCGADVHHSVRLAGRS